LSESVDCRHGRIANNCAICEELAADCRDEGCVAVSDKNGCVVLDFGPKPVSYLAIDPDGALAFAYALIDRAMAIKTQGARAMAEAFKEPKQ
jgi:hypothetical protein